MTRDKALEVVRARFGLDGAERSPVHLRVSRHRELIDLWRELGYTTGAEIGTEAGRYAEEICRGVPGVKLHCVDPYLAYDRYENHMSQQKLDGYFVEATQRLSKYRAEIIREASLDAVRRFEPASLDFVFIDGNHHFDFVVRDIIAWAPIVRPGGFVAGHDYKPEGSEKTPIPFGVIEAVNAYTTAHKISPWFVVKGDKCPSWFWVKE